MRNLPQIIVAIESYGACERELLKGIYQYARENGPWLFCHETDQILNALSGREKSNADGIVVCVSANVKTINEIAACVPCIIFGCDDIAAEVINVVRNAEHIGRMAADYLLSLGFEEFGFCGTNSADRLCPTAQSFTGTIQEAGFNVNYYPGTDDANTEFERELAGMTQWIVSLPKPVGIMAGNDDKGMAVLEACKAAKADVPGQVVVLGVGNDTANCEIAMPPLSSVALNTVKVGFEAAKRLDCMMRQDECCTSNHRLIIEPTRIVVRQSTNMLAVSDTVVAEALDFIRANVKKPIQVSDVASSVSVSRRELERRFKRTLKQSIHQEIKRAKVQLIAKMLLETSDSISEIASKLAFADVAHVARYFRDIEGISPIEYRKRNLCAVQ